MDTWLADTSTCEGAAAFGNTGQRTRRRRRPDSQTARCRCNPAPGCSQQTDASASGSGVQCAYNVQSVARPWKSSATAVPLRRRWALLSWWHGRVRMKRVYPVHAAGRLTSHRYPCRRSASFSSRILSFAISGPAPTPSSLVAPPGNRPIQASQSPASHQPAESPKVPSSKSKPKLHPVDEPGPASAHPLDS